MTEAASSGRVYATHARSNFKVGCDVGLGLKTVIWGKNEGGKSTVVDSLTVPMFGVAFNVGGKNRQKESALMGLAPGLQGDLWSEITFSDGTVLRWSTSGRLGSAKKADVGHPTWLDSAKFVDMREVHKQLTESGDDTRRRWLLENAGIAVAEKDVLERIPARLHEFWKAVQPANRADDWGKALSAGEALAAARVRANDRMLEAKRNLTAADDVVKALSASVDAPLAGQIEQAEGALKQWEAWRDAVVKSRAASATAGLAQGRLLRAQQAQARLHVEAQGTKPKYDRETAAMLRSIVAVVERQADVIRRGYKIDGCVACGHHIDPATIDQRTKDVLAAIDRTALEAQAEQEARHSALSAQMVTVEDEIKRAQADIEAARQDINTNVTDEWTIDRANREVTAAAQALEAMRARATHGERKVTAIKKRDEFEATVANYGALVEKLDEAIPEILQKGVGAFEARVQQYLPAEDKFKVLLEMDGSQVCLFGLQRPDGLHVFLSGSAWERLTLAIGCVLAEGSAHGGLLVGTDCSLSGETLTLIMRSLRTARCQIVLTSAVAPAGRLPKEWTVLSIEDLKAGKAVPVEAEAPVRKKREKSEKKAKATGEAAPGSDDGDGDNDDGADDDNEEVGVFTAPDAAPAGAPDWVIQRGHPIWVGAPREDSTQGTGGMTLEEARQKAGFDDAQLVESFHDPANAEHRFFRYANGVVVRHLGSRIFLYRPPEDWGQKLWEGPLSDVSGAALGIWGRVPDVKDRMQLSRGQRWYFDNGAYAWQQGESVSIWSGSMKAVAS